MSLKRILFPLLLILSISCGGGGGGSCSETTAELNSFLYPIRVGELDKNTFIVAELTTGKILSVNKSNNEKAELQTLAPFTGNGLGISGLLVDKDFNSNGYVFIYHGTGESGRNVLTRLTLKNNVVEKREQLLLLTPPSGHNGGGMYQLSNGDILLGIGDGGNPAYSKDASKLEGKILILDRDGRYKDSDNGLPKGIYAKGFRNPFGITGFNNDNIFVADNGPDCDDEINILVNGADYGWKENYTCGNALPNETKSIFSWSPSKGLTDILAVKENVLLVGHYNSNRIIALTLNKNKDGVDKEEEFLVSDKGPVIDLLLTKENSILCTIPDAILSLTN